jgi:flagellar basal body-associated protein FliL
MKNYNVCDSEIAKSAKTCPYCGAKNKKTPIALIIIAVIIVAIIVVAIAATAGGGVGNDKPVVTGGNGSEVGSSSGNSASQQAKTVVNIGDTVETNTFEITILSVEVKDYVGYTSSGSSPRDGGLYVAVKFEYKNTSDKPIDMYSLPSIKLQDSKGTNYSSDYVASLYYGTEFDKHSTGLSDLNPGIKAVDGNVFEISIESYEMGGWSVLVEADKEYTVTIK